MVGETSLETLNAPAVNGTETALEPEEPAEPVVGDEPEDPFNPLFPFDPMTEPELSTDVDPEGKVQGETSVVMTNGQSAAIAEKLSAPMPENAMVCIVSRSHWQSFS